MKDFLLAGCTFPAPFLKGRRMPSTAEDVLAETRRPLRALSRERRNRFDLESFIKQVYAIAFLVRYANEIVARERYWELRRAIGGANAQATLDLRAKERDYRTL